MGAGLDLDHPMQSTSGDVIEVLLEERAEVFGNADEQLHGIVKHHQVQESNMHCAKERKG